MYIDKILNPTSLLSTQLKMHSKFIIIVQNSLPGYAYCIFPTHLMEVKQKVSVSRKKQKNNRQYVQGVIKVEAPI